MSNLVPLRIVASANVLHWFVKFVQALQYKLEFRKRLIRYKINEEENYEANR